MTNEQLAKFIKEGDSDDLKPVLWERVKKLLYKKATQEYNRRIMDRHIVHEAVAGLDEPYRSVILRYFFKNMTLEQIGKQEKTFLINKN